MIGVVKNGSDARTAAPDQLAGMRGGLRLMHLVDHQLPAVDVLDHVPVEEAPSDRAGHPRDVPAPDLVGAIGLVGRDRPGHGRFAAPTPAALARCLVHAVERRLARKVNALIGQLGHDLVRRQAGAVGPVVTSERHEDASHLGGPD